MQLSDPPAPTRRDVPGFLKGRAKWALSFDGQTTRLRSAVYDSILILPLRKFFCCQDSPSPPPRRHDNPSPKYRQHVGLTQPQDTLLVPLPALLVSFTWITWLQSDWCVGWCELNHWGAATSL